MVVKLFADDAKLYSALEIYNIFRSNCNAAWILLLSGLMLGS